jgi:hypothetical protein
MDARRVGVKPIVVPRRRALNEHVDDHQVLFARRVAEAGYIELVEAEDALRVALDAAIADPSAYRIDPVLDMGLDASIRRFQALADRLLGWNGERGAPHPDTPRRPVEPAVSRRRGR